MEPSIKLRSILHVSNYFLIFLKVSNSIFNNEKILLKEKKCNDNDQDINKSFAFIKNKEQCSISICLSLLLSCEYEFKNVFRFCLKKLRFHSLIFLMKIFDDPLCTLVKTFKNMFLRDKVRNDIN